MNFHRNRCSLPGCKNLANTRDRKVNIDAFVKYCCAHHEEEHKRQEKAAQARAKANVSRSLPKKKKDREDDDDASGRDRTWQTMMMLPPLLDMKTCGLDTDSAVSASTRRSDFLTLDSSQDACDSMDVRGV